MLPEVWIIFLGEKCRQPLKQWDKVTMSSVGRGRGQLPINKLSCSELNGKTSRWPVLEEWHRNNILIKNIGQLYLQRTNIIIVDGNVNIEIWYTIGDNTWALKTKIQFKLNNGTWSQNMIQNKLQQLKFISYFWTPKYAFFVQNWLYLLFLALGISPVIMKHKPTKLST